MTMNDTPINSDALDACTEGPAVAPEIRLAAAMRYGKPWPL